MVDVAGNGPLFAMVPIAGWVLVRDPMRRDSEHRQRNES
jgi:hypothetical protein